MKTLFFLCALFLLGGMSVNAQNKDQWFTAEQSPQQIKTYVAEHFPNNRIDITKKDWEFLNLDYEVKLDNRIELEFDENFNIKKVEAPSALPKSIVPKAIRDYVAQHFPKAQIITWESDRNNQIVELDNGFELYFSQQGEYVGLDD